MVPFSNLYKVTRGCQREDKSKFTDILHNLQIDTENLVDVHAVNDPKVKCPCSYILHNILNITCLCLPTSQQSVIVAIVVTKSKSI